MNRGSLLRGRGTTVLQINLVAEHTEIYRKVADGDTFFGDNSSTDFETIRRHFMRQRDDTFILSEALEGFLRIQIYWPKP